MAIFLLQDTLSAWMNLGKHSLFVRLFVSSVKRGTRRVIRPDELSSVVRRSSAQQKIAHLDNASCAVFTLKMNNQTNKECLPKFVQTHHASSNIKTANLSQQRAFEIFWKTKEKIVVVVACQGNASFTLSFAFRMLETLLWRLHI